MHAERPLRVRVVINALGEGGTERSMAEMTPLLATRGVELRYAILRSRGEEGVELSLRSDGVRVDVLPRGRKRIGALRRLIHEDGANVVHSMLYEANLTARLASARLRLGGRRVPLMTSIVNQTYSAAHKAASPVPEWKQVAVQIVDAVTGRLLVDHWHAVSQVAGDNAAQALRIPRGRMTVVGRGRADPFETLEPEARSRIRSEFGIPESARVVVCVGRQEHQKDLPTLIRAMAPALGNTDVRLLLVGRTGAASGDLQRAVSELADHSGVVELGHRGDVAAILAASDVFVMTSHFEGMPGAVIEAMSMGLPVVASDIGPVREVVESGTSALLAPPGNVMRFSDQIERLLNDAALRDRLGARGREIFEERFRIELVADAMAGLYRDVASGASPREAR